MMAHSKLFHLLLALVISLLSGVFILLLVLERSLWIPAKVLPVFTIFVLFPVGFCLNLFIFPRWKPKRATRLEHLAMMILLVVGILMGLISYLEFRTPAGTKPTIWLLIPAWILPALVIILLLLWAGLAFGLHREDERVRFRTPLHKVELVIGISFFGITSILFLNWLHSTKDGSYPLSFDGNSDQLRETVIVPTLDTPVPSGKSAVWCASFQIAWNKFKAEVAKGPVQVKGAESVAERLNLAEQSEDHLEPGSFYAAAGLVKDGIMEKIRADMSRKFPQAHKVDFRESELAIAVAFAYLQAELTFSIPFQERRGPIFFLSSKEETAVKFFGISEKPGQRELRDQVEVLYHDYDGQRQEQYAVDRGKSSLPNQIVLALLPKRQTLGQILADLNKKSSEFLRNGGNPRLEEEESLGVPNMHWRIDHHFKELEGRDKPLLNPTLQGTWIGEAVQVIEFKLDRRGASLTSQAKMAALGTPKMFLFNRPFLLYMKKRGAKHPFFVMWMDNAELLIKN